MTGENQQNIKALASEYVLGLLSSNEAAWVERQLAADDALRADVEHLKERLQELDLAAASEPISDGLWAKIERRLDEKVVAFDDHQTTEPPHPRRSGYWRGFVSAAIAASLLFAIVTGAFFTLRPSPQPLVIAVLLDSDANPGVIVEVVDADRVRIVPLIDIPVPEGQALEVWTLPDPNTGPVSLGLLQTANEASLAGFNLPRPAADQLYEISLEPATGSPEGRPTGPVLFKGSAKIPR